MTDHKFAFIGFFLTIFLFLHHEVRAQDPVHWTLTDEDGLPSMTVYKIIQDSKGYIWIGTEGGLCRYNGYDIQRFSHPQQKDQEILTLEEDKYGRIWFSNLAKQLFYYHQDSIHLFYEGTKTNTPPFQKAVFSDSLMFLIHVNSPIRKPVKIIEIELEAIDKTFKTTDNKESVLPLYILNMSFNIDKNNQLFFFYQTQQRKTFQSFSFNQKNEQKEYYFSLSEFGSYKSIFIHQDRILSHSAGRNFFNILYPNKTQKNISVQQSIRRIKKIDDDIFFLTSNGLIPNKKLEENQFSNPIFKNYSLNDIIKDTEGNYWIGTDSEGVIFIPSFSFFKTDLFESASTYALKPSAGTDYLYAGHNQKKISLINNRNRKVEKFHNIPLANGRIMDIAINESLGLIIGSDKGLFHSTEKYDLHFSLLSSKNMAIKKVIANQKLWVATNFGTRLYFTKKPLNLDNNYSVISDTRTYGLYQDYENTLWVGTIDGLYTYKNDSLQLFSNQPEISKNLIISDITQSSDSSIWVATNNTGLLRIKNDSIIKHYNTSNFLGTNDCKALFLDDKDFLWIATSNGLYSLHLPTNEWQYINKYDGLPSSDIQAIAVKDSIVWVSTSKGLVSFPKQAIKTNTTAPRIHIVNVLINNKDTTLLENYDLTYDKNSIQISFEGLAYRCRSDVNYEYRLLGLKDKWETTNSRFIRYHSLSPGQYTFEVKAINEDGTRSAKSTHIQVNISPPWWQTWWFRSLAFLIIAGVIWGIIYMRFQRLRKQEAVRHSFEKKVNELHMLALQSQMNPHFIFNALNAIQLFLTTSDEENAMIYLARFARLIRLAFEQSKEQFISLEQELEFLKLYLSLESLRFNNTIDVNLIVEEKIKSKLYDFNIPPLLIQPVIENAFKHGLFHKKEDKKLVIKFEESGSFLKCTITDNGIGRKKAATINEWKNKNHQSSGLKNTEERLRLLHQVDNNEQVVKFFIITDLVDKNDQAIGTKVEILFNTTQNL